MLLFRVNVKKSSDSEKLSSLPNIFLGRGEKFCLRLRVITLPHSCEENMNPTGLVRKGHMVPQVRA